LERSAQNILLIEDSPEDVEALLRAARSVHLTAKLTCCASADEAFEYLRRTGRHAPPAEPARPVLILLDLNLPGMNGLDFLTQIKADAQLKIIPVVVLSTSTSQEEIDACYRAGASSYLPKRLRWSQFKALVRRFNQYWFEAASLPSAGPSGTPRTALGNPVSLDASTPADDVL
jgi:CheY-like chemotaxis protein